MVTKITAGGDSLMDTYTCNYCGQIVVLGSPHQFCWFQTSVPNNGDSSAPNWREITEKLEVLTKAIFEYVTPSNIDDQPVTTTTKWQKIRTTLGEHVEYLMDTTSGRKLGEVRETIERTGDDDPQDRWFEATDCRRLPYKRLGEFRGAKFAREAVMRAITKGD